MSSGIWLAASGAAAQMMALETTANNLANVGTTGFKAQRPVFQEHLIQAAMAGNARPAMRYSGVAEISLDPRPGPVKVTARKLDVAVEGDGFFAVSTPQGERFTRAGAFHVSAAGGLTTGDGHPVLGSGGSPVSVPLAEGEVSIASDGTVLVGNQEMGQLRVVRFESPGQLQWSGGRLFNASPRSGLPQQLSPRLQPGALELANVSVVKGMTDMVSVTRTFEALERAVEVFSELERRAANDIASGG